MKTQNLFVIAAIVCLLMGASGAAVAEEPPVIAECFGGAISGGEYDGIEVGFGQDCTVVGAVVGDLGVKVKAASIFIMMNTAVSGDVRIVNTAEGTLISNFIESDIVMKNNKVARALWNVVVGGGNIRVIDNRAEAEQWTEVLFNQVVGNLRVNGNLSAQVNGNRTRGGNITCRDNENLEAHSNFAPGGRVACFRDPFPMVE